MLKKTVLSIALAAATALSTPTASAQALNNDVINGITQMSSTLSVGIGGINELSSLFGLQPITDLPLIPPALSSNPGSPAPAPAPNPTPTPEHQGMFPREFGANKIITVDACDLRGLRAPNVKVDIGFGERQYWAVTNQFGQLKEVHANRIELQRDNEPQKKGRYCRDEAKVPGTERKDLDEGHVIADSLGGVSNAYNITPQNSRVNRHGDQYEMEKLIRLDGGANHFHMVINYPNNQTQIPSDYEVTFIRPNGKSVALSYLNS